MEKVRLNILGLSYSQTRTGAYALILGEENGKRRLPVIIGTNEAQAIAIQLEGLKPYRPLTHDLFVGMASAYHISVVEVNIIKLEEGIFYSELVCERDNARIKIDSRTSDAVALALRFKCPIFVNEDIMEKASVILDEKTGQLKQKDEKPPKEREINEYSIKELRKMMGIAIDDEDYETASILRDELNKREEAGEIEEDDDEDGDKHEDDDFFDDEDEDDDFI